MNYSFEQEDDIQVLKLTGSLLAEVQSKEVLQQITELIQEGNIKFVVDLTELKFINSSGLGMLLTCLTKSRKAGGDVLLANVPEQVSNLLVITKLEDIFTAADSVEEAKSKFNN